MMNTQGIARVLVAADDTEDRADFSAVLPLGRATGSWRHWRELPAA